MCVFASIFFGKKIERGEIFATRDPRIDTTDDSITNRKIISKKLDCLLYLSDRGSYYWLDTLVKEKCAIYLLARCDTMM